MALKPIVVALVNRIPPSSSIFGRVTLGLVNGMTETSLLPPSCWNGESTVMHRASPRVGYHKRGYPKQEPKILLEPCNNQSRRTTTRPRPFLRFARGLRRGLRRKAKALRPAEALSPRRDTNSPIRPRLDSATTLSPPSRPTPLTKRHVQLMRPTTPATSAARWRSTGRVTDGTGDRVQQGLPATMLITVPPADSRTALCYLTPVPRTKWRGGSSPGPSSLGISMKDRPFILCLV